MKKLLKTMFAVIITFLCVNVYAEETTPKIIINAAGCLDEYSIYELFTINDDGSYKANGYWLEFFKNGSGKDLVTVDANGYILSVNAEADMEKISTDALKYISDKYIDATLKHVTDRACYDEPEEIEVPKRGYYLVKSPIGNIASIATANPTATIYEKNTKPVVELKVKDGDNYSKDKDVFVGDTIEFRAVITFQKGAKRYYFELLKNAGITINTDSISIDTIATEYYEIKTENFRANDAIYGITIDQEYLDSLTEPKDITITYTGYLNKDATINNTTANSTGIMVYYSDYNTATDDYSSISSFVRIYSWRFFANNYYYTESRSKEALVGSHFVLSKTNDVKNPEVISLVKLSENGEYRVAMNGDTDTITEMITTEYGLAVYGLDGGTYYLIQTSVPDGYNKLVNPVKVELIPRMEDGYIDGVSIKTIGIENSKVSALIPEDPVILPVTGGPGTVIMITAGILLFVLSLCAVITKLRIKND